MVDVLRTENVLLIVTPGTFISWTLGMAGTAGGGITTARRLLGDTKTISIGAGPAAEPWMMLVEIAMNSTSMILHHRTVSSECELERSQYHLRILVKKFAMSHSIDSNALEQSIA